MCRRDVLDLAGVEDDVAPDERPGEFLHERLFFPRFGIGFHDGLFFPGFWVLFRRYRRELPVFDGDAFGAFLEVWLVLEGDTFFLEALDLLERGPTVIGIAAFF